MDIYVYSYKISQSWYIKKIMFFIRYMICKHILLSYKLYFHSLNRIFKSTCFKIWWSPNCQFLILWILLLTSYLIKFCLIQGYRSSLYFRVVFYILYKVDIKLHVFQRYLIVPMQFLKRLSSTDFFFTKIGCHIYMVSFWTLNSDQWSICLF